MDEQLRSLERLAAIRANDAEGRRVALVARLRAGRATETEKKQLALLKRIDDELEALRKKREDALLHTEAKCLAGQHILRTTVTGHKGHVIDSCELCSYYNEGYDD